jgi:hypothetical protein
MPFVRLCLDAYFAVVGRTVTGDLFADGVGELRHRRSLTQPIRGFAATMTDVLTEVVGSPGALSWCSPSSRSRRSA